MVGRRSIIVTVDDYILQLDKNHSICDVFTSNNDRSKILNVIKGRQFTNEIIEFIKELNNNY